jgi:hypothetical protein
MIQLYFLLLIILFYIFKNKFKDIFLYCYEFFENENINFLDKKETIKILLNNEDNYYNRFNFLDLKVRNVNNINEYKNLIIKSPVTISYSDKIKIKNNIQNIRKLFDNYSIIGFDGKKANTIKWNLGFFDNNLYEGGYPHTRNNIIMLPLKIISSENLFRVLVHEFVHIYQKIYHDDILLYLKTNNFKLLNNVNNIKVRANPDIDQNIYMKDNDIFCCIYNNNPKNLMDVTYYPINNSIYEHPYEYMAYSIENEIKKNFILNK